MGSLRTARHWVWVKHLPPAWRQRWRKAPAKYFKKRFKGITMMQCVKRSEYRLCDFWQRNYTCRLTPLGANNQDEMLLKRQRGALEMSRNMKRQTTEPSVSVQTTHESFREQNLSVCNLLADVFPMTFDVSCDNAHCRPSLQALCI